MLVLQSQRDEYTFLVLRAFLGFSNSFEVSVPASAGTVRKWVGTTMKLVAQNDFK